MGAVNAAPLITVGLYHWNADVRDYINILTSYHHILHDQEHAFSRWFTGNKTSTLTKSTGMKLNTIYPNEASNFGLVNRYKILLRKFSRAIHFILKKYISRSSYTYLQTEKSKVIYTDDCSGRNIMCGLILLMMALQVMKPQMVIGHQSKERKMEDLTMDSCKNNVHAYLSNMQEMRNEIVSLQKYGIK